MVGRTPSIRIRDKPSKGTLVPSRGESIDFDDTKNIFIEGENLEVLKILQKAYEGLVKMIYIDPPYNTGSDRIYVDDYVDPLKRYLQMTGQVDAQGNLLTSNPETSGRFHSTWLSMMFPRLFFSRELLAEDGVIFVSIDEHESHHLRLLMNEIYGEENFIAEFIWKGRSGKTGTISAVSFQHEYILCYSRSPAAKLKMQERIQTSHREQLRQWGQEVRRDDRPTMYYPIKGPNGVEICPITDENKEGRWRVGRRTAERLLREGELEFEFDGKHWQVYKKIHEGQKTYSAYGTILDDVGTTADGTKAIQDLFGEKVMDFPKPPSLIKFLAEIVSWNDPNAIVLDFFAGSSSTAQAILELNREDAGK